MTSILIVGAGAVGGYVGGSLARAGEDVSLVDPWPEHVNAMREHGLRLGGTHGEHTVPVRALHLTDVQGLTRHPVDIAIVSTKSYDTAWAATMVRQYLAPEGYVVSLQNSINEEQIARAVGWGRTVGCIASTISVNLIAHTVEHTTLRGLAVGRRVNLEVDTIARYVERMLAARPR